MLPWRPSCPLLHFAYAVQTGGEFMIRQRNGAMFIVDWENIRRDG